ncbi:MAG: hypothetical protein AB6733_02115 [Clostridiaceae bacterium]
MEILKGLLQVKVIIALIMTLVFCYLTITEKINPQDFVTVFSSVLAFFFGQAYGKQNNSGSSNGDNNDPNIVLRSISDEESKVEEVAESNNDEKEIKKEVKEEEF